jgi:hypothetical protein
MHKLPSNIFCGMNDENIPFTVIDWHEVEHLYYPGEHGLALWKTLQFPGIRMRIVEYSAGYVADHWCQKGHIVYCLEGEFTTEQSNGQSFTLKKGMSYIVTDEMSTHRSVAEHVVKLLIIDGDFLKYNEG